jgi:hypothetical protein
MAARNGVMLVSHYRHLVEQEGEEFGREMSQILPNRLAIASNHRTALADRQSFSLQLDNVVHFSTSRQVGTSRSWGRHLSSHYAWVIFNWRFGFYDRR